MKMKYLLSSLLCLAISFTAIAKENPGADYLSLGEVELAKSYFMKTMRQSPANAYYYLGEIAYMEGKMDEAKQNYQNGLNGNPACVLCEIGLAKVELKSNAKAAEDKLSQIQKNNKKDVQIILAIAQAFESNGMKEKADAKFADARKADKKSPYIYIYEGDQLAKAKKLGEAAMQYDQAINFDPNCIIAYVKGAQVYENINSTTAIGMLKKAIEIDANYIIAYKYLGRIYSNTGFFKEAIEAYEKYFATGNYNEDDIKLYAGDEYYFKNFAKVKELSQEGLKLNPNNFVLNRLLMYSFYELKEFDQALAAAKKYFSLPKATDVKYIPLDYTTYGGILKESGQKNEAIAQYQKAIEVDSSKVDLYKEIATICAKDEMPAEAAGFYKQYIAAAGAAVESTDYYQLGTYYYTAAANDMKSEDPAVKEKAEQLAKEADKAFEEVATRVPENYLGYFYRARVNSLLDPETTHGLAKPYYEEVIKIINAKSEHENNRQLVESYRYLAYYFYLQSIDGSKSASDKENAKMYCEKILQLDSENSVAKQLLDAMK